MINMATFKSDDMRDTELLTPEALGMVTFPDSCSGVQPQFFRLSRFWHVISYAKLDYGWLCSAELICAQLGGNLKNPLLCLALLDLALAGHR